MRRAGRRRRAFAEFVRTEAGSGGVLLAAALVALAWANSPWDGAYADLWSTDLSFDLGFIGFSDDLHGWTNDGLMTAFFFVVGLEIKRELVLGELNNRRAALLPVAAALGGMVVPALVYLALNAGGEGERGWGIPMATDIAFAVGALALLGARIPLSLRVFLLALAIVDDIGAIAVIALFYSDDLALDALAIAAGFVIAVLVAQRLNVRAIPVYAVIGVCLWAAVLKSGVHPTVAGVALGLLTPAAPLAGDERSPLERIEHRIHPWTSYAIVPIFALANAGVKVDADAVGRAFDSDVTRGVALGLVLGKPAGVLLFAWLATALRLGSPPSGVRWREIAGVAMLAGIGFTVSLFVTELAFDDAAQVGEAKLGVLAASLVAGALGYATLLLATRGRDAAT